MLNKIKVHVIKNSLEGIAKYIFEYLCKANPQATAQENKELAIEYSQMPIVKLHHVGQLYKVKALRYTILSEAELHLLDKGMAIVNRFFELQRVIEDEGYKILCSPSSMKSLLLDCKNEEEANEVILILEKELLSLEDNINKKHKEKYESANRKELTVSNLNESQKESLYSLGCDGTKDIILTLSSLKRMYNQKLYSINYDKSKNVTDEYIKELSDAFFNVKTAFEVSC